MELRTAMVLALAAASICAQPPPNLEIRGRVIEPGLDIGVAGAEVTLIEFVVVNQAVTRRTFATAFTDSNGNFRFQPLRLGDYYVEVRKEGYQGTSRLGEAVALGGDIAGYSESPVTLTKDRPREELRFRMVRPGEITGRAMDEDREPIAGLRVAVQERVKWASFAELTAVTDQDGLFTVPNVPPGEFFVRISPEPAARVLVRTEFSPEDAAAVDQQYETAYWPGDSATPSPVGLRVSSGATASVGTIIARKVPYYRVHVNVAGECVAGQNMSFTTLNHTVFPSGAIRGILDPASLSVQVPCAPEFLVTNLKPGAHFFALTQGPPRGRPERGAYAPKRIESKNAELMLTLAAGVTVNGRMVAAEDADLPLFTGVRILTRASELDMSGGAPATPDDDGTFTFRNLLWPRHQLIFEGLPPKFYVQQVRYNGRPVEQNTFTVTPGAELEVVIDDKAAFVNGRVMVNDTPAQEGFVAAVKWPLPPQEEFTERTISSRIRQGNFEIGGLAPGDYRMLAVPAADGRRIFDWTFLSQALSRVETTRVGRGESRTLTLRLLE